MVTHECLSQDCTEVTPYPLLHVTLVTWTRGYGGKRGLENAEMLCKVWSRRTKTISVSRGESLEIRLLHRKLNSRKRGNSLSVYNRNSLKYTNDQRGSLDWNWLVFSENGRSRKTQDDAPLQYRATKNKTTVTNKALVWIYLRWPSLPLLESIEITLCWVIVDGSVKRAKVDDYS